MPPYQELSLIRYAKGENFPVASCLLSGKLRLHIKCFYNFARSADNIADNPTLSSKEKIKYLNGFEKTLMGEGSGYKAFQTAHNMYESLKESGVSPRHCMDLLQAFKQDAIKSHYSDWADLVAYCALSAAPVGRYMIDLHGEPKSSYRKSDSLCSALQLINHLQDCGDDYMNLGRVYLPMNWVNNSGLNLNDLSFKESTPALRRIIDWTLIGINRQLSEAESLPIILNSSRLSLETSIIYQIAKKLSKKLSENDPLSRRIRLSKSNLAYCFLTGVAKSLICRN